MKISKIEWTQPDHDLRCVFDDNQAEHLAKISTQELPDLFRLALCNECMKKTEGELLAIIKGGKPDGMS